MTSASIFARLSALAFAAVLAGAAAYGAAFAAFALDYDALDAARSGNRPVEAMGFWRRPPDVKPVLASWAERDGMGGAARRRIALDTDTPANSPARFLDVTRALQQEPTSGWLWLEYTSLCLELPFCREKAAASDAMIAITARREGLIQREEAFMLLKHWEHVSPEMQKRTIARLDDVMPRAGREGEARFKDIWMAHEPRVQEDIKMSLARGSADATTAKTPDWQKRLMK